MLAAAVALGPGHPETGLVIGAVDDEGHRHRLQAAAGIEGVEADIVLRMGLAAILQFHHHALGVLEIEHDGGVEEGGGIRRWLRLAEAVGLDPAYVASARGVLPSTRFAVDAYVSFVREKPLLEAVASSLTELFAPKIHSERIAGLLEHYAFADDAALAYFRQRLAEAPRDVEFGLAYVLDHA